MKTVPVPLMEKGVAPWYMVPGQQGGPTYTWLILDSWCQDSPRRVWQVRSA